MNVGASSIVAGTDVPSHSAMANGRSGRARTSSRRSAVVRDSMARKSNWPAGSRSAAAVSDGADALVTGSVIAARSSLGVDVISSSPVCSLTSRMPLPSWRPISGSRLAPNSSTITSAIRRMCVGLERPTDMRVLRPPNGPRWM